MSMNIVHELDNDKSMVVAARPVSVLARIWGYSAVRRVIVILLLAVMWQVYAVWLQNPLMFPTLSATLAAFGTGIASGEIPLKVMISLEVLLIGYVLGITIAGILVGLAATSRFGASLLETLSATLMPLPSIVLLPMAMLWFGLGIDALIFVLLHAVIWVVAMNTHAGFGAVSETLRMVGRNYGLSLPGYVVRILVPAAFPSILSGLKVGWAFAWRTLVAAELIFGTSARSGGLGWYIYTNKNELEITNVFAGLLAVIAIGLIVDSFIFRIIERKTLKKWGMQSH
jgi:NitT/TauT family transport system permease protein